MKDDAQSLNSAFQKHMRKAALLGVAQALAAAKARSATLTRIRAEEIRLMQLADEWQTWGQAKASVHAGARAPDAQRILGKIVGEP